MTRRLHFLCAFAVFLSAAAGCDTGKRPAAGDRSVVNSPASKESRPKAARNVAREIDGYLAWLSRFETWKEATASQPAAKLQQLGGGGATSPEAVAAVVGESVAAAEQISTTFKNTSKPPPECAELARLYGDSLAKATALLQSLQTAGRFSGGSNLPDGSAEMQAANAELERIRVQHPDLKTPPFSLRF